MNIGSFEPVSNRVSWADTIFVFDSDPGDTDITGCSISMAVRDKKCDRAVLSAEVGSGITITDATGGEFTFSFTRDQMYGIDPGTYKVGITITFDDGSDDQLFIGTVEVKDGIVP